LSAPDDAFSEPDDPWSPDEEPPSPDDDRSPDDPCSADDFEPAAAARVPAPDPPRSFFAQPDPLKWIVGGANILRIVPSRPHDGQNFGPGSLIPWRMSARWSQALQAYS